MFLYACCYMYILLESVGICMSEALDDLALTAGEATAGV